MDAWLRTGGGTIWAEDSGGGGTPIVLLHGGWTDSRIWDPLRRLLPAGLRTIRYDARGCGRSTAPSAPFSPLGDLKHLLDHVGLSSAVVVGHSGGGATAVCLALEDPRRVSQLVLLAPGISDYPWPFDDPYFVEFEECYAADDRDGLVRLALRTWAPADRSTDTHTLVRDAAEALLTNGDLEEPDPPSFYRLGEIDVPTTLLVGDRDHHAVLGCAAAIAERIPGCRRTVLAGVDHMVPLRVPELIADIIAS